MWLQLEMIFNPLVMGRSQIISSQFTSIRCLLHCQHSISIKTHSSKATATYNRWVATRIPTKTTTACQNARRQSTCQAKRERRMADRLAMGAYTTEAAQEEADTCA